MDVCTAHLVAVQLAMLPFKLVRIATRVMQTAAYSVDCTNLMKILDIYVCDGCEPPH